MIAPGIRVARGPNWSWHDQGEFFLVSLIPILYDFFNRNNQLNFVL